MKYLVYFAVFWQVLNCSAYCHSGNRTASGVWPQVKDRNDDGELRTEESIDIPMNYCPNCGRKLT